MLKSPNDVLIESKDGRGSINMRGTVNIETAVIRNLTCNAVNDMRQQIQDLRRSINQLQNTNASPTNLQSVVQQVIRQQFNGSSSASSASSSTSNQDVSLINARLNTLQDQMNALETRINTAFVSIDERFIALQNSVGSATINADVQTSSDSQQSGTNSNVVILRKTPVTNKNVRYAW
jgi:hypothetical protein